MQHDEQLSALIGDIYDAALDPALWVDVLARCARYVGGPAALLVSRDTADPTHSAAYYSGFDPQFKQHIVEKHVKIDPLMMNHIFARIGEPIATTDVIPNREFRRAPAYREWGRPQGLIDVLHVALDKSATSAALFSVFRHKRDGRVDNAMRRRMWFIHPHIRRAVLIGRVIRLQTAKAATFADALDGISAGMFLVDARGRIIHTNASGHALLTEGRLLHSAGGKLAANDASAEKTLHEVFIAAGSGDVAVGTKAIAVPVMKRDGERFVAHVLPLTSGARRRAGTSYGAAAALFVHKAALEVASPPEAIAKTFKLTPSELRVLLAIVEVGGVPEAAEALGVGPGTVKTHLLRVFAKTGTSRQAELVKLVAGFSNPLVG
ncbi:MAG TPA: LuxR family transcriptional regulator [Hyphomicrobiaceae bacterium]|jgi:DNA-binding CsgD family transcriptional regulator|nr:LuxR family transcriptional regulator [Hyphomicrobiaceae bacterium]